MPVGQKLFYHEYDVLAKMKVLRKEMRGDE